MKQDYRNLKSRPAGVPPVVRTEDRRDAGGTSVSRQDAGATGPRGSVLIVTIGVTIALTGLALVFSRQMRVEALASGNLLAGIQANAVASGAAQHAINRLANNQDRSLLDSEILSNAVPLGEGQFWMLRPDPEDERRYAYGIVDEASKLNINSATEDMLLRLPGMTPELAASIVDWRDEDSEPGAGGGAENEYYLLQPEPYYCKNAAFETLDELRLVKGATQEVLYGVDANQNGVVDEGEADADGGVTLSAFNGQAQCGVCKYLTVYSVEVNKANAGQGLDRLFVGDTRTETLAALSALLLSPPSMKAERVAEITARLRGPPSPRPETPPGQLILNVLDFYVKSGMTIAEFRPIADLVTTVRAPVLTGLVNVNTAPREVLRCLPGLDDGDIDLLIAKRSTGGGTELDNIAWVAETLPPAKAAAIGGAITTRSLQYSADIVATNGNGRGFKRCKYVFDLRLDFDVVLTTDGGLRNSLPATVLRKDLTHLGWPLDPAQKPEQVVPPASRRSSAREPARRRRYDLAPAFAAGRSR